MTSRRIDRILLALGALLVLASSYQLFLKTMESGHGPALGTLTSTLSVVKTKSALSMDWRDALSGHEVSQDQLIYTDDSSSAEVAFMKGGTLQIGENSLVRLKESGSEQALDLRKGFIQAKLDRDHPVKVQMNGSDYLVSGNGADIQINLHDEKAEIGVLQGEVKVESGGVTESLDVKSALSIEGELKQKKTIAFQVTSPAKNETRYTATLKTPVTFTWTPEATAQVSFGRTPAMEGARTFSGSSGMSVVLEEGLHYFRVEGEEGTSLIGSIRLVQERAPSILRPLTGEKVGLMEGKEPSLLLQWKDPDKETYEVEWDDGDKHTLITTGASSLIRIQKSGLLRWRLRVKDEKRPLAVWSPWQEVEVSLLPVPTVPTDMSPHDVEFQTYAAPEEKIDLKWKSATPVELEVVDPAGGTTSLTSSKMSEDYTAKLGGAYRWRARAIDQYLRTSDWSEWKTFTVEDLSGERNGEGVQRIQLKRPEQTVTFSWNAGSGTVSVFELAKDPKFKEIVKRSESKEDSVQVSIPEPGEFYWRSRQYLPDGTFTIGQPRKVIIEPVPAPIKPHKLPDMEVPLQDFPVKTIFFQRVWDAIFPSAYADDEAAGMAKIELPTKEEAKGYVVRIYKDEALTQLAFETELTSKEFVWKFATPGTYYWQYAVIDYWDRRSPFSDPAVLTIKEEPAPLPVKPKLLSPIRAIKLKQGEVVLEWTKAPENESYRVEVSRDKSFTHPLYSQELKGHQVDLRESRLSPGMYFWKVWAMNRKDQKVKSNIGRFVVEPPFKAPVVVAKKPVPRRFPKRIVRKKIWKKEWRDRMSFAWTPSMDSYSFRDSGETGKIDGHALMGLALAGTSFKNRGIINAELTRQTGKVFKGESYLFQRLILDYVYSWDLNPNHRFGIGPALGQASGQGYEIQDGSAKAQSVSGLIYGAVIRDYVSFNSAWEMQSKIEYLAGEIPQIEAEADLLKHQKNFFFLGGVGFSSRNYSMSEGKQTSLKISLGIGKEF